MPSQLKQQIDEARNSLEEKVPEYEPGEISNLPESVLISGAAILAGVLTRRALMSAWKAWRGSDPPVNPVDPEVDWRDAVLWGAIAGTTVGVARIMARRGSTAIARRYYEG